jgi:hypothetical protein
MGILHALQDKEFFRSCLSSVMQNAHSTKCSTIDLDRDLPPAGWLRWNVRRKAAVVIAVRGGRLGRAEARERYRLSDEELSQWEDAFDLDGIAGLLSKRR